MLDGVRDLYTVDLRPTFDPAKLEVVDADGDASNGVQFEARDFMDPAAGFTVRNEVSIASGRVTYVFALRAPP